MAIARASGSGPAPDPNSRRQQRPGMSSGWVDLPNEGCSRPVPSWPLATKLTDARRFYWDAAWRTPQAEAWHVTGTSVMDVARYVDLQVRCDEAGETKDFAELRQWSDRLGLNPPAMARNRWRVRAAEIEPAPDAKPAKRSRTMLSAVPRAVETS